MWKSKCFCWILLALALLLGGVTAQASGKDLIWAVNAGGPEYLAVDGTPYSADEYISGGDVGTLRKVLGSQDEFLYKSYREGDIRIDRKISNGSYTLTFHFAEPAKIGPAERLFDVFAEGRQLIADLDVMKARDGKLKSALTVTFPDVEVLDGELNIHFEAHARSPLLSALTVRVARQASAGWELVWSDEFDYEGAPDPELWSPDIWPARVVNDEDQAYTDRQKNLRVEDGVLIIEAHREDFNGAEYTSARIHSNGKGELLYGRVEVRARLPVATGTWSAAWMLPSDPFRYASSCQAGDAWQGVATCDAWPNSGEIDIIEHVGFETGHIHGTVHNRAFYWQNWQQRKGRILIDDVEEKFHVYALEWSPEKIDIFVDGSLYFTYVNEGAGWRAWPYDHPFHLVLNLAVGGAWGRAGGPIDATAFPQKMLVDFVRVYRAQ